MSRAQPQAEPDPHGVGEAAFAFSLYQARRHEPRRAIQILQQSRAVLARRGWLSADRARALVEELRATVNRWREINRN